MDEQESLGSACDVIRDRNRARCRYSVMLTFAHYVRMRFRKVEESSMRMLQTSNGTHVCKSKRARDKYNYTMKPLASVLRNVSFSFPIRPIIGKTATCVMLDKGGSN